MADAGNQAATREQLWTLYGLLLDALLDHFENPPEGGISAAFMNVARQFLKDNGAAHDMSTMQDLRNSLGELRALSLPFKESKQ